MNRTAKPGLDSGLTVGQHSNMETDEAKELRRIAAKLLGQAKSEKKAKASRINGLKGDPKYRKESLTKSEDSACTP